MNISEEKRIVYQLMAENAQERRNLAEERRLLVEEHSGLKQRLDKLIDLELSGLEQISVGGYVELHNSRLQANEINNIRREMEAMKRAQEEKQLPTPVRDIRDELNVTNMDRPAGFETNGVTFQKEPEQLKEDMQKAIEELETPAPQKERIPKKEILESKDKEIKKKKKTRPYKKHSGPSEFKQNVFFIKEILKEAGEPLIVPDLQERLEEKLGKKLADNNFRQNILYRANRDNDDIIKLGGGYYTHEDVQNQKEEEPEKPDEIFDYESLPEEVISTEEESTEETVEERELQHVEE